ncbi:DUF2703 domain-containing protein [bacterium]|nr:DUF2703 domain-containing protein [bacterium]MBU1982930.1 DUF2703 domain-containing protein [bacterium]
MRLSSRNIRPSFCIFAILGLILLLQGITLAAETTADRPTLVIQWQRLVTDKGQTCQRCGDTGKSVRRARKQLASALKPLGIKVVLEKERMSHDQFLAAPAESNRIYLNGCSLEEILQAEVGSSVCCDACEGQPCRTVTVDGLTFETIPPELIVRAGLLVAADLLRLNDSGAAIPCCPSASGCCPKTPEEK